MVYKGKTYFVKIYIYYNKFYKTQDVIVERPAKNGASFNINALRYFCYKGELCSIRMKEIEKKRI